MAAHARSRPLVVLLVSLLVATACGARVSDEQRTAAVGGGGGGPATATGGATGGGGGDLSAGPGEATAGGGATTDPGTATGGGAATGGEAGGTATTLPPGGNGGATDVGVTADQITVGNIATLSGPVPGLFQGATIGAQAFAAYVNGQGGINGRKLKVIVRDDQFDSGQNRAQAQDLSKQVLAMLGSFSTFDDAGQPELEKAGVPDVGYALSDGRRSSAINFSPQPAKSGTFRTGAFNYYAKKFPGAVKNMATLYGDVPASKGPAFDAMAAARSVGWNFVYDRAYQPTETDFTADVVRMRQAGVKGFYSSSLDGKTAARLIKAIKQQGLQLEFIALGASGYDAALIALGGDAVEGTFVDQQLALYQGQDSGSVPEVGLMNQWMQKIKPGYTPDLFAAFAWASGRILEQALKAAGPQLTRKSLLAALQKIDKFDANGLMPDSGPASKRQPTCDLFMQVKGGKYSRIDPPGRGFICGGTIFSR